MKKHAGTDPSRQLVPATEVARQLSISVRKVWRLVATGELPKPVKVGTRSTRIRQADVHAFVDGLAAGR